MRIYLLWFGSLIKLIQENFYHILYGAKSTNQFQHQSM